MDDQGILALIYGLKNQEQATAPEISDSSNAQ
jgi:hypothetical protein